MTENYEKADGARTLSPGSSGNQSADKVSTSEKKSMCSPFVKTGKAQLSNQALRIDYLSFGTEHSVYIGMMDLDRIMKSRFEPAAPVKEIRTGGDGAETAQKVGYACRTASGKALKINTTHSNGDLLLPWANLLDIVSHKRNSAPVSRIVVPDAPRPAPAARNIREGLTTGF